MKQTALTSRVTVTLLTDPDPERVSLVRHGANQEPFRLVKHADIAHDRPMKKSPLAKGATSTDDSVDMSTLQKAVFDRSEFADEAAVTNFLTERGYAEFTVKADGDTGFVVEAATADQFSTLSTVTVAKGVTYHVGERKTADGKEASADAPAPASAPAAPATATKATESTGTPAVPAVPAAPTPVVKTAGPVRVRTRIAVAAKAAAAAVVDELASRDLRFGEFVVERADGSELTVKVKELAAKYDSYGAYASTATNLADVLNDGLMDGVPVGFGDVMTAYRYAVRNAVLAGDVAAVKDISWELGLLLVKLANLTNAFTASKSLSDEDKAAALKAFGATEETFLLDDSPPAAPEVLATLCAKIETLERTIATMAAPAPAPAPVSKDSGAGTEQVTQTRKSAEAPEPGTGKSDESGEEGHGTPVAKEDTDAQRTKARIHCDAIGLRQPVKPAKP